MSNFRRRLLQERDAWELLETYVHESNVVIQPISVDYDTATFQFEVTQGDINSIYTSTGKCHAIIVPHEDCMPQNMPKELVNTGDVWIDGGKINGNSYSINGWWNISSISRDDNPNLDVTKFHFELLTEYYPLSVEYQHSFDFENYDYRIVYDAGFWGGRIRFNGGDFKYSNQPWGIRTLYQSQLIREATYNDSMLMFTETFNLNTPVFADNIIRKIIKEYTYSDSYTPLKGDKFRNDWSRTNLGNGQTTTLYRKKKSL